MATSEDDTPQEGLVSAAEITKIRAMRKNPQTYIDICNNDIAEINQTVALYHLPNKYVDLLELLESHKQILQEIMEGKKISLSAHDLRFDREKLIDVPHLENFQEIATTGLKLPESKQQKFLNEADLALHSIQNIAIGKIQAARVEFIMKNIDQPIPHDHIR